jgi:hypothetical protein
MSKIPETGEFTFGDVITELGTKVEDLDLDKYLMSSYLGITPSIPTKAPLLLSDFKGLSNALVLRTSDITGATQGTATYIDIGQQFINVHTLEVCNQSTDFIYIHDVDFKGLIITGGISLTDESSIVIGYIWSGGSTWSSKTKLHFQLEADLEGRHHGVPILSSLSSGISWYFDLVPSTPSHKYFNSGNAFAKSNNEYLGTYATSGLIMNRSISLHRVSGNISGGDGKGGDVRLAYCEKHGRKYIGKRWVYGTGKDQYYGSEYVENSPTYSIITNYAYAIIPGSRASNPSPPFSYTGENPYSIDTSMLNRMTDFISSKVLATEDSVAVLGLKNETYHGSGVGISMPRVAQPGLDKDWITNGKTNGGDTILTLFNHYFETVLDEGTTPSPIVIGDIIINKIWSRTDALPSDGINGIELNGYALTITEV